MKKWWGTHLQVGANEEDENEGETLAMTAIPTRSNFPSAQQCHRSTNIGPSHYPSPNHPQKPSPNQPQGMPAYHTPNAQTPPIAQTKKEFCNKKPVGFTPNSGVIC